MNICELLENNNNNNTTNNELNLNDDEDNDANLESITDSGSSSDVAADSASSSSNAMNTSDSADTNQHIEQDTTDYNRDNSGDYSTNTSSEKRNNQQLSYLLSSSVYTSGGGGADNECNSGQDSQDNSQNQMPNHMDFSHSILSSSSVEDEFNFDRLGPYEKLCSLCDNPTPSNMESASKYLVPALEFCTTQENYMRVFSYLRKYCFFSDMLLRSLWLEQIQSIIQYLHQEGENIPAEFKENFNMPNELALLISDLMHEPTYQVKKYATASLLCIIERQLLNNDQIEKVIIPSLLNLVKENNEDFHIDCVSLFGKLAPLIGPELTAKYFLEPFCRLSTSPVFHTRKACASNITELANVVSTDEVEKYLIPHFCEFMKDQVWAIRKVCADIFPIFAIRCKRKTREDILTEYFIRLLDDNSRWVKISAYKSLGSFIATFSKENSNDDSLIEETQPEDESNQTETENKSQESNLEGQSSPDSVDHPNKDEYSNFIYWRNSLPSLDDTNNATTTQASPAVDNTKTNEPADAAFSNANKTISSTFNLATQSKSSTIEPIQISSKSPASINQSYGQLNSTGASFSSGYISNLYSSTNSLYSNLHPAAKPIDLNQLSDELKQDVVPPILLSYFITMIEMNAQNSLDAEMNYNCAFNFPAIALTLGLANWKYVKNLYKKLAEDNNWKVRQTLAYSIHELAIILGTECTQQELVAVFDSFIKDVDEVRMGIVANLSKFLRVLSLDYRRTYMPKLNDFLKMDNQRNWRFRNELGLQIAEFCELFPTDCIAEFIQPVTYTLANDKIAEVRMTAIKALTNVLKQFEINNDQKNRLKFIEDVISMFANSSKWSSRQLFVFLCENIFKERAYQDLNGLSRDLLPKMFSLRTDTVPNIRVCLARVISTYILNIDYFTCGNNPISTELDLTLDYLNKDKENDVRSYFSYADSNEHGSLPPYEEVLKYSNQNVANDKKENQPFSNSTDSNNSLDAIKAVADAANTFGLNDSLNLMNYGNSEEEAVNLEDEDDEDDDDEIIDTTKVGQLKIVNELDNDMEDDSDEVIDTSPLSPDNHLNKNFTNISFLNNHLERTKLNENLNLINETSLTSSHENS